MDQINMSEKLKVEFYRPFGPTILKTQLPENLIKDLNQDCDAIVSGKQKGVDWSHELAGRVKQEWHFSKDILSKYYSWVIGVTSKYLFPTDKSYEDNKDNTKIGIVSGWYVRQFEGDFNPSHFHTGCQISCVGYLKMPEDINEYWKEEDKDHNPFGGYIDFRYGTIGLNCPNNVKIKPQVGEFYMFPNFLDHAVYPFKSKYKYPNKKGERRSFSMNIEINYVKKN